MKWDYDKESDVMYITFGEALPCVATECYGVVIRKQSNVLNGVTIVDYLKKTHDKELDTSAQAEIAAAVETLCECYKVEGRANEYAGAIIKLRQLKAEIRAISDIIIEYDESGIAVDFPVLKRRLRELSAV